jgi:hypothetical protein
VQLFFCNDFETARCGCTSKTTIGREEGGAATSLLLPKTLTEREQSTFSVWSSPSWTRRRLLDAFTRELRRIAASEYRVEVNSGRVAFRSPALCTETCACGEEVALLLLDKRPQSSSLIVGWKVAQIRYRYRYRCSVSVSVVDGLCVLLRERS